MYSLVEHDMVSEPQQVASSSPREASFPQVTWAGTSHVGRHVWVVSSNGVLLNGGSYVD